MSKLSLTQIKNLLPDTSPKHEHLLSEIESTDISSIGFVIRWTDLQQTNKKFDIYLLECLYEIIFVLVDCTFV